MPAHRRRSSRMHLHPLISRSVVLVNHAEFVRQSEETFRMSNQQIPFWIQAAIKLFNESLLLRLVEINHYVAAEDDVISLGQEFRLEVVEVKMNSSFRDFLISDFFSTFLKLAK